MIRSLVIVTLSGLIISVICLSIAGALIGRDLAAKGWDWSTLQDRFEHSDSDPGPNITREIAWTGADKLSINVPSQVVYVQSLDNTVVISGPERIVERLTLENGEIRRSDAVRYRWRSGDNGLRIEVRAASANHFEFNGAQQVEIRSYDQETLTIEVNGAAQVEASGRAGRAEVEMNGAGEIDLSELTLASALIEMNGAGEVTAGPTDSADVEINGVGEVTLLRRPANLTQRIHGIGRVQAPKDETAP